MEILIAGWLQQLHTRLTPPTYPQPSNQRNRVAATKVADGSYLGSQVETSGLRITIIVGENEPMHNGIQTNRLLNH